MATRSNLSTLNILSVNTRGTIKNYSKIIQEIKFADIVLLQEQYIDKDKSILDKMQKDTKSKAFHSTDPQNKRSVIILVKDAINDKIVETKTIIEGRVISIKMRLKNKAIEIWNIYAPAAENERLDFFKKLFTETQNTGNIIMGGDFNTITEEEETSGNFTMKPYMAFFKKRLERQNLKDAHKTVNTGKIKYTFTTSNKKIRKRLDKFIYNSNLQNRILDYYIKPNIFSDHEGICIKVDLDIRRKWGKGIWKLNNEVLKEEKYRKYMTNMIKLERQKKETENLEPGEWWDKLKKKIKKETIYYCRFRMKNQSKEKRDLEKNIDKWQGKIDQNIDKEINADKLTSDKLKLTKIIENECRGARIRAKVDEIEKDERSTRHFFSKEHTNGEKKQIRSLLKGQEILTEEKEVMEEVKSFYSNLYCSEGINGDFMEKTCESITEKLEEKDREKLNKYISEDDISKALLAMKNNKSPGEDGISKEFYIVFKDILIEDICEMLNNILFKREMPKSLRNAIITLLYKKNDHRMLKNWRPVSLLNTDYKILSKILANRLREVISKILPTSQKCGAPNRQMSEIMLTIDSICEMVDKDGEGALMCLDQEKAFDRVNHTYLFKILETMGMNGNFLTFIKSMYAEITCQVNVNGKLTSKINISRSVRQGCSISMLLFVLSSTPILNMIEKEKDIKGIKTKYGKEIKVLAYADDTTIMIRDAKSIEKVLEKYEQYAKASEAKINIEKTEILKLGKWKKKMPQEEKYKKYVKKEVKILGALFHENRHQTSARNWEKKEETVLKIIKSHEKREISLFGKVLLINSLIMSQFWHIGAILQPNKGYTKKIYKLLNSWINGQNGEYIIEKIMKPKNQGGAGLINLEQRLSAIKVKARGFLISGKWDKEQEIMIYWAGTRTKTLANMEVKGPRCERCDNYNEDTFKLMVKHNEDLKDIEKIKVKKIQEIIYGTEEKTKHLENIYNGKSMKLVSLNYRIATNILKTAINRNDKNRACSLCNERTETIYHLFLECPKLTNMREDLKAYANSIRKNPVEIKWGYIINMGEMENHMEYEIISLYKKAIWKHACDIRFNGEKMSEYKVRGEYERDIRFYLRHIYEK